MRKSIVKGSFYPSSKKEITEMIDKWNNKREKEKSNIKPVAGIIPHAGYVFSGKCADSVFSNIKNLNKKNVDLFIILGPNHTGLGSSGICNEDWETPFGTVETDKESVEKLTNFGIIINNESHAKEHSIEVQMPLIKYYFPHAKVTAITVSEEDAIDKITDAVTKFLIENDKKKTATDTGKKDDVNDYKNICLLVSSDFTHYGRGYGYVPFYRNIKENMHELDMGAVNLILKKDFEGFKKYIDETGATICGYAPAITLLKILSKLEKTRNEKKKENERKKTKKIKGKLIDYYTSADVMGDYSNAVGYAGILFCEGYL